MRETTIARNYAETLLELARRGNDMRGWGVLINDVAKAINENATLRLFLESPRVAGAEKSAVLGKAFGTSAPRTFVRFLQALVTNRRQMLIPAIALEYLDLLDAAEG